MMEFKAVIKWFGFETGWWLGEHNRRLEILCIKGTILTIGIEIKAAIL